MIKVLLVDDSALVRAMLKQVIKEDPRFTVVGEAENGLKAIAQNRQLSPDLIIMDINMPVMNGIEATSRILANSSPAVIGFSTEDSMDVVYQCVAAGALEVVRKPEFAGMTAAMLKDFYDKIYLIAQNHKKKKSGTVQDDGSEEVSLSLFTGGPSEQKKNSYDILLIGASTGGPAAVQTVLQGLGSAFPLPILVAQHIDDAFDVQFAKWLNDTTGLHVELAQNGTEPLPGHVYLAPAGHHLMIGKTRTSNTYLLQLNDDAPLYFLKPAVDKLFFSAAEVLKNKAIAVLLTGMGRDGAEGCSRIMKNGGYTIAEAESSCVVFGMPKAAIDAGAAKKVLALTQIAPYVKSLIQ